MVWECVTEWDSDRSTVRACICVCVCVVKAAQRGIKLIEKLTMPTSNWKMRLYANEIILYVARTHTHTHAYTYARTGRHTIDGSERRPADTKRSTKNKKKEQQKERQ